MKTKLAFLVLFFSPALAHAWVSQTNPSTPQAVQRDFNDMQDDLNSRIKKVGTTTLCIANPIFCIDTVNSQVIAANGTVAHPSYAFSSEHNTGMFRDASNIIGFSIAGSTSVLIGPASMYVPDGAAGSPGVRFLAEQHTGFYRPATNAWGMAINSANTLYQNVSETDFYPNQTNFFQIMGDTWKLLPRPTNVWGIGNSSFKFTEVWATNGTIQTSSSKEKSNIKEITPSGTITIDPSTINLTTTTITASPFKVPRGILFNWKSAKGKKNDQPIIGFLGDDLPEEAHAIRDDGTRDPDSFYTSSVIGLQSAAIRDLQARVAALEAKVK